MKISLLALFVCVLVSPLQATSNAVIRWKDGVVVAADSRAVDSELRAQKDVCKVIPINKRLYETFSGTSQHDQITFADIFRDSIKAHGLNLGFRLAVKQVNEIFASALPTDTELRNFVDENGSALTAVIFGYTRHSTTPVLYFAKFFPKGNSIPEVHKCPSGCSQEGLAYTSTPDGIAALRTLPHLVAVRQFVQTQIDSNNPIVGPPIQVLSITKDGAKWDGGIVPAPCK
jgi:hypothetical protein